MAGGGRACRERGAGRDGIPRPQAEMLDVAAAHSVLDGLHACLQRWDLRLRHSERQRRQARHGGALVALVLNRSVPRHEPFREVVRFAIASFDQTEMLNVAARHLHLRAPSAGFPRADGAC